MKRTYTYDAGRPLAPDQEPAIDAVTIAELGNLQLPGEPDALAELVDLFLTDAEPRVLALRAAAQQGNAPAVAQAAHALIGSCSIFGARPMARICENLQANARSADLTDMPDHLLALEREFARVRSALQREMRQD